MSINLSTIGANEPVGNWTTKTQYEEELARLWQLNIAGKITGDNFKGLNSMLGLVAKGFQSQNDYFTLLYKYMPELQVLDSPGKIPSPTFDNIMAPPNDESNDNSGGSGYSLPTNLFPGLGANAPAEIMTEEEIKAKQKRNMIIVAVLALLVLGGIYLYSTKSKASGK